MEGDPLSNTPYVGRRAEMAELTRMAALIQSGRGTLVLVSGEAGIGKSRLISESLVPSGLLMLHASGAWAPSVSFSPITRLLRSYLLQRPVEKLDRPDLTPHLAKLIPELGSPDGGSDRGALLSALEAAFMLIAGRQPTTLVLEDLHTADDATLELLPALAEWCERTPLLVVGSYRTDELPRGHLLRRIRLDLRRAGRLRELSLKRLGLEETATLAARILGRPPAPALAHLLQSRTQGVPFFVEELTTALVGSEQLCMGALGLEWPNEATLPIPDTVRDLVLVRTAGLPPSAREALEVASVAGLEFDLDLAVELHRGEHSWALLLDRELLKETTDGRAAFRHAMIREALYAGIPWLRRRQLHRTIAGLLQSRGAPQSELAAHWLAARDWVEARQALLGAMEASCQIHAYRDAARSARRALELWPDGQEESQRLALLHRLGQCAELYGESAEAIKVWQAAAAGNRQAGNQEMLAEAECRLAILHELAGSWQQSLASRTAAAAAFEVVGRHGEAAEERLAAAEHLESAGNYAAALELVTTAAGGAARAGRVDLQVCALVLEGVVRAQLGQTELGLQLVRSGLALGLEHHLTGPVAEGFFRLASTLDLANDIAAARSVYLEAIEYCQDQGIPTMEQFCRACLAVVLLQAGEWEQALNLCEDVLSEPEVPPPAHAVAAGILGCIHALKGDGRRARRLLIPSEGFARQADLLSLELYAVWGLAMADELEGNTAQAAERCRYIRRRWESTHENHYAVHALRWSMSFFARFGADPDVRACAQALTAIATATGRPEALAAVSHALGECALLDGQASQAFKHFGQALEILGRLEAPLARVQTLVRAGAAGAQAGERGTALYWLTEAYRTARKLGAVPLARLAAEQVAAMGERLEERLGRQASRHAKLAGLTRREAHVLHLLSMGRTNREIGRELFLSTRTVEMHVAGVLSKLNASSRTEAVHRAHELGLLRQARHSGLQESQKYRGAWEESP